MPNTPKLPEDERLKKVRDERSSRLNKPPHQKYRKLYRFAEDWFEYHYETRVELKKLIAEVENQEAQELATLKAQVRKEIEELKKSAAISEIHWDDDQKTQRIIDRQKMYAHNQAITDCLSIPSLKGEE